MSKLKKFGIGALIVVLLLCLGLDCWLMYYHMFLKDNFTLTTAYVDDMAYSKEEKFFIECKYFPNMFEAKLNYYTDTNIPEYDEETKSYGSKYTYSSGVQFDGGYQAESIFKGTGAFGWADSYRYNEMINCTYYNTTDSGTSFTAIKELSDQDKWVYDIDGKLVLIKERGYIKYGTNTLGYSKYQHYGISLMFQDLYNSIKSLEDGVRVVTFDLSNYFTFAEYNTASGKFEEEVHETKETWMFINVKVTKSSNDFVSARESMFGMFKGDANWSLYDLASIDYWRARNEYNIGISSFTFVYENGGYYLKLQQSEADFLSAFTNMKYVVTIDLDNIYLGSQTINVAGFAEKAFGTLGIEEINLTSEIERDFNVYSNYNINCPDNITINFLEVSDV